MARNYRETRIYPIDINEVIDRVRALIIVGNKGYIPGHERKYFMQ